LPIGYFSKHLTLAQLKKVINEKELMSLVTAMQHWRMYLLGKRFIAVTDHKPLKWIMSMNNPPQKLCRWLLTISEFQFDLEFRSGSENGNADALSRWLANPEDDNEDVVVNCEESRRKQCK
jgi:hypothetical protein